MKEKIKKIGAEILKKHWKIILVIFIIGLIFLYVNQLYKRHKGIEEYLYSWELFLTQKCEKMILGSEYECPLGGGGEDFYKKATHFERTNCFIFCRSDLGKNQNNLQDEYSAYRLGVETGLMGTNDSTMQRYCDKGFLICEE